MPPKKHLKQWKLPCSLQQDRFVKQGNVEGVKQLIRFGTPLDDLVDKRSPLMRATLSKKLSMARVLLDMGASVDFKNEEGQLYIIVNLFQRD